MKPAETPVRVVLIDDHEIIRFGLETLLQGIPGVVMVGGATSLAEAMVLIDRTQPDVAITDMSLGDSKGLDTVQAVVAAQQGRAVLVLSMHDELVYAGQALALGARGYIMKDQAYSHATPALRAVANGDVWVSPKVSSQLLGRLATRTSNQVGQRQGEGQGKGLTVRELQVLEGIKKGQTTKEIAYGLALSARTVDIHRANIKRKLGVRSGAELLTYALARL